MAALADLGVAAQRGRSGRRLVRVVATHAAQRSATLRVAGRFAQPVGGADEFDPVIVFALARPGGACLLTRGVLCRARRSVEMQDVIFKRLARTIGESATAVALQTSRKLQTGGFQMALHTNFHLTVV